MAVSPFRLVVTLLGLALLATAGTSALIAHSSRHNDSRCVSFDAQTARTLQQVADQAVGKANRPRLLLL
jgi:hypothetical protein